MRIGRYRILFGRHVWFQTCKPTVYRQYLGFIWILEEVDVNQVTDKPTHKLGTEAYCEGRKYRYYKAVGNGTNRS